LKDLNALIFRAKQYKNAREQSPNDTASHNQKTWFFSDGSVRTSDIAPNNSIIDASPTFWLLVDKYNCWPENDSVSLVILRR
jgi:hypothetical protein